MTIYIKPLRTGSGVRFGYYAEVENAEPENKTQGRQEPENLQNDRENLQKTAKAKKTGRGNCRYNYPPGLTREERKRMYDRLRGSDPKRKEQKRKNYEKRMQEKRAKKAAGV